MILDLAALNALLNILLICAGGLREAQRSLWSGDGRCVSLLCNLLVWGEGARGKGVHAIGAAFGVGGLREAQRTFMSGNGHCAALHYIHCNLGGGVRGVGVHGIGPDQRRSGVYRMRWTLYCSS